MKNETIAIVRHILQARIDNAKNEDVSYALRNIATIVEYAIKNDTEALRNFDYMPIKGEMEYND